ncbi:MAG: Uma2 family endonuclease [Isosphaeraceae bacterium]
MSTITTRATLDDLLKTDGKAELIGGRIVHFMASGFKPSVVALEIAVSLREYEKTRRRGFAASYGMGFVFPELPSGRESFCPDAAYFDGLPPARRMRFVEGPPTLAVEVRSENDYGDAAELDIAAKRADYFAAGTLVVWDVDPEAERIHVYRSTDPENPTTYARGQTADAEPAVPGWRVAVDDIFG